MNKLTVRELDAAGKKVFVRVDFNVPIEDGKVTDDSRIRAAIPTIALLLSKGAAVILASHLGRPNGRVVDTYRLRPVAERLSMLIGRYVPITGDALGVGTQDAVNRLKPGQVLMLENLRFHSEEEANDPKFARTLASYADVYVNDAFGTAHRAHASTVGITEYLPAYAGLLLEREVQMLSRLLENPERPFAAVLGGAKVSGKIKVLDSLTERVDTFVVGGGMANNFLVAKGYTVGKSLLEKDRVDDARRVLETAEKKGINFVLPVDVVVAKEVTRGAERKLVPAHKIPNSWSAVDVGPQTRELFEQALESTRTVFWNGPLGVFEVPTFGDGTRAMARYLARRAEDGVTVVVGGGDSVAAVEQLGLTSKMTHISTGGGASLEFLESGDLPGIAALLDREPAGAEEKPEPLPAPATPLTAPSVTAARPAGSEGVRQPVRPLAPATRPVGVRALDATTPIATVDQAGDGAATRRAAQPGTTARSNGRRRADQEAATAPRATARTRPLSAKTPDGRAGETKAVTAARKGTAVKPGRTGSAASATTPRGAGKPASTVARASTRPATPPKPPTKRATSSSKPTRKRAAAPVKAMKRTPAAAKRTTSAAKPAAKRGTATSKSTARAGGSRASAADKGGTRAGGSVAKPKEARSTATAGRKSSSAGAARRKSTASGTGRKQSTASGGGRKKSAAKRSTAGASRASTTPGSPRKSASGTRRKSTASSPGRKTTSSGSKRVAGAKPVQRRTPSSKRRRGTTR